MNAQESVPTFTCYYWSEGKKKDFDHEVKSQWNKVWNYPSSKAKVERMVTVRWDALEKKTVASVESHQFIIQGY